MGLNYTVDSNGNVTSKSLTLTDTASGVTFPLGGTLLNRYEESGTILLSATGALNTTFVILIKRIGRMCILDINGFAGAVTSVGNKIVSTVGVASQFRPASTITWTVPIINGILISTRDTGELSIDSSGIITVASANGDNFVSTNAGIIGTSQAYFVSL